MNSPKLIFLKLAIQLTLDNIHEFTSLHLRRRAAYWLRILSSSTWRKNKNLLSQYNHIHHDERESICHNFHHADLKLRAIGTMRHITFFTGLRWTANILNIIQKKWGVIQNWWVITWCIFVCSCDFDDESYLLQYFSDCGFSGDEPHFMHLLF